MSEGLTQALERLVAVFISAGLVALAANLTVLQNAISDPAMAALVFAVGTAIIQFLLKLVGGPTAPLAALRAGISKPDRPHWWAV